MPRIISFAWTSPAFCNRQKFVTRRNWKPDYAATFKSGDELVVYDRSPRTRSALVTPKEIGLIKLAENPYPSYTRIHNSSVEYEAEGFGFYDRNPSLIPVTWQEKFLTYGVKNFEEYWNLAFDCHEMPEALQYRDYGIIPQEFNYVIRFSIVKIFPEAEEYLLHNLLKEAV